MMMKMKSTHIFVAHTQSDFGFSITNQPALYNKTLSEPLNPEAPDFL